MNSHDVNRHLYEGHLEVPGLLPHLDGLKNIRIIFQPDFGLDELPREPGILLIRGPRQYGKSTWLETNIRSTIKKFGSGTVFYLNGDDMKDETELGREIEALLPLYKREARVKRLFIDEITAIRSWEKALKRLFDQGLLRDILVVSTGSKATDLRHGAERLPGRKGKLSRNTYLFTPVSYTEFKSKCGQGLGRHTLAAYLLSGGCPIACNEIVNERRIPEYIITMIQDWIYGECVGSGRHRSSLLAVMEVLLRCGGSQVGQTKLAQESGLANNTVAAGYIELLADLMVVAPAHAWHVEKNVALKRKPSKFHFTNTLVATAWHPSHPRTLSEFESLPETEKSKFYEWAVAQELWRRNAIKGEEIPEQLYFWRSEDHEIDFVIPPDQFLEVKVGAASPLDFQWFPRLFPHHRLDVVNAKPFHTARMTGLTLEEFLLG